MTDSNKPEAEAEQSLAEALAPVIEPGKSYKGLAIASLVVALIGLVIFGLVLDPIAIILGTVALNKMRGGNNSEGRGIAIGGIIIGILGTIVPLILVVSFILSHHH